MPCHNLKKAMGDSFLYIFLGEKKWRAKVLLVKEDLFVFEDLTELGYRMPLAQETMTFEEIQSIVISVARFHAQTFIIEENLSQKLNRPYRLWEEYSEILTETRKGQQWREVGSNAVIDFLKVYSKHKLKPNFATILNKTVPKLFEDAFKLMDPSNKYRNTIVHRDLWTNNIFLKQNDDLSIHALILDFQTVIYSPPMLDLTSLLYFNTDSNFRNNHTKYLIDLYYCILTNELELCDIDVINIIDKQTLYQSYEDSILFGITQASLIIPLTVMDEDTKNKLFGNPSTYHKMSMVSRSEELIECSSNDDKYRQRITELFDELIERFIDLTF